MNKLLFFGGLMGLVSVITGAAGGHFFVLEESAVKAFDTAVRYNMIYAVFVSLVGVLDLKQSGIVRSAYILLCGSFVFCFSIYLSIITGMQGLTYLTPVGGIVMMAGWCGLIITAMQWRRVA